MEVIAIDSLVLIYWFENHPRYADYAEEIFRRAERRRQSILFSMVGVTEIFTGVKKQGDKRLLRKYVGFFQDFPYFSLIDVDFFVADRASDLRARYNIRTPDALHLASAIEHGASVFISNDRRLKAVKEIKVMSLEHFS